jgi:Ca-activated chloride channel homolog
MTDLAPTVLPLLTPDEAPADSEAGLGCLRTDGGNLPLRELRLDARITGLTSRVVLTQRFVNPHREALEATYVFPLPDRGAVTGLTMTAGGRTVTARLREREQARAEYDAAVASGRRAAIAEEERPDVFTLRVGNVLPGEEVSVELTVVGLLPVVDGEAEFRFPLVVAPRYVPGTALPGDAVGEGHLPDTDAVPDASRISPPVLLPGFPNPVRLDVGVTIDPAGLPFGPVRSSLHAVREEGGRVRFAPGERADRDIVLRWPLAPDGRPAAALTLVADPAGAPAPDGADGTFEAVVLPPDLAVAPSPRDVVLVLDRSGSMSGWKMVAARRAAARIVDTLTAHDRFAVLAFDHAVETVGDTPPALVPATDRHRFRAVEFLAGLTPRGGTELAAPLQAALGLLTEAPGADGRQPVLVLVTDGQVGNEDQLLRSVGPRLAGVRVHTVGIDQAVNAGFLGRLAGLGRGRCELVESEDRLDDAMARIHERIGSPLVQGLAVDPEGIALVEGTYGGRLPDLFPGVPWVLRGRYRDAADPRVTVRGTTADGEPWSVTADGRVATEPALASVWARGHVRDLEDRYVTAEGYFGLDEPPDLDRIERRIVETSLTFGVLSRFTAYVAVDERVVTDGSAPRRVIQPVERPAGWAPPAPPPGITSQPPVLAHRMAAGRMRTPPPMATAGFAGPAPLVPSAAPEHGAPGIAAMAGPAVPPPPVTPAPPDDDLVRELLDRERRHLAELADAPVPRRRAALADLGSWLGAVSPPVGVPEALWDELLAELGRATSEKVRFDAVWSEVLRLIERILQSPADSGSIRRPTFWKHRRKT